MTDPIRPFINLIESIAGAGSSQKNRDVSSQRTAGKATNVASSAIAAVPFSERLATRLSVIDRHDRKRRRQAFVELALLSELGQQIAVDHAMGELVDKVSSIIAADHQMTAELDDILDSVGS